MWKHVTHEETCETSQLFPIISCETDKCKTNTYCEHIFFSTGLGYVDCFHITKFTSYIPFYAPSRSLSTSPSVVPIILPYQDTSLVHSLVPISDPHIYPSQAPSNETPGLTYSFPSVEHDNIPSKEPSVLKYMVTSEDHSADPSYIPSYTPSVFIQPTGCTVCTYKQSTEIIDNNEDYET